MSEITQILFNSPALHSLKRDQLVKLCKIHSVKASGKNVELIERLKAHALTLPSNAPLSVAMRREGAKDDVGDSEDEAMGPASPSCTRSNLPRPSEQWEVVMDDIEEIPEGAESHSQGTLSSLRTISGNGAGEFGTGGTKSSSMSSSIKAFANSLGFKRAASTKSGGSLSSGNSLSSIPAAPDDDLVMHSTPYRSIPEPSFSDMPQTDHFQFSTPDNSISMGTEEALPGDTKRPGAPAPFNARLSTGAGATTTIRLVSTASSSTRSFLPGTGTPQLKPFATSFDLILGSPGNSGSSSVPVWPLSPGGPSADRLYPSLTADDFDMPGGMTNPRFATETPARANTSRKSTPRTNTPKTFPKPSNEPQDIFSPVPGTSTLSIPSGQPFIFGSPLPQHNVSNKAFGSAAASVLEEMNRRLSAAGAQKVGMDFLENRPHPLSFTDGNDSSGSTKTQKDRFEKLHEDRFNRMDSITTHYAARRGAPATKKRKSDVLGRGAPPSKKRASAETRVISNGARKRMIPGGFNDEEEDEEEVEAEEESDRRMSKRIRVVEGDGGLDKGKRVSLAPELTEKEEKKNEKDREAVRRMLDKKREKRRSSMRRVSGVTPQPNKGKGTSSRFGFLSSAKSMVRSVWNIGSKPSAPPKPSVTSNIPVAKPASIKPDEKKGVSKPSLLSSRPSTVAATAKNTTKRVSSTGSTSSRTQAPTSTASSSSRTRNPLPVFKPVTGRTGTMSSAHSRASSVVSTAGKPAGSIVPPSSINSRMSTHARQSSEDNKAAASRMPITNVSSMGARRSAAGARATSSIGTAGSKAPAPSLASVSSRLFAPTASSLAKTRIAVRSSQENAGSTLNSVKSPKPSRYSALSQITNSPPSSPAKRTPGKIFSKPLSPTMIPSPVKPTSLSAAASTLASMGSPLPGSTSTAPAKPKAVMARKPRISRSRVIAKLGAQRAAAQASSSSASSDRRVSAIAPRTRSSVGTGIRRSHGGGKATRGSDVLLSAKKRARQSEYMRRKSRAGGSAVGTSMRTDSLFSNSTMSMDVDD
ncbi:hypothetical protein OF83DRAFT_1170302 [Amylostereum chailletii]|nr:hypothetical protein OF83DRAFT_1170302 [Amylostereum chailletii]